MAANEGMAMKARPATTAPAPTHTQAIELLRATHLFSSLAELDLTNLAASCDTRDIAGGELLITQGEPGDDLFVIVSGKFRASHTGPGGDELVLGDVMAGEFVGEAALLERTARTANVRALVPGQVLTFSRTTLERFLDRHPDSRSVLTGTLGYRVEWSAARSYRPATAVVIRMLGEQMSDLDEPALHQLENEVQWVTVPRGTLILKQGTPGDCLYFVVTGRLRAFALRDDGSEARIGEIGPRESVGEMALLSNEPRSANVAAVTDCQLLRLSKRGFDRAYGGQQTNQGRELWTFNRMNFARVAEEIGALGIRVEHPSELSPALRQALAADRPVVIDVVTDIEALAPLAVS